jgi:HK97 family phage prohead protease
MADVNDDKKEKVEEQIIVSFLISDETVNRKGFRILTSGIILDYFLKNPIAFWIHKRANKWDSVEYERLPIGKWINVRKEGDKLFGDLEFDMDDPYAVKLGKKAQKGILSACSMGILVVEESIDPKYILPGQQFATVTKCELEEVSLVDIPANRNAVKLRFSGGKTVGLNEDSDELPLQLINNQNEKSMKEVALALGLDSGADQGQILTKVKEIVNENTQLKASKGDLEKQLASVGKSEITRLVDGAIAEEKLTASQKAEYIELGEQIGAEKLTKILSAIGGPQRPTDMINGKSGNPVEKKFSELSDEEVKELKANNFDEYKRLYKLEYGIELKQSK